MRKSDIIKDISKKTGIERIVVEATVEALMSSVKEHVCNNEMVSLRGVGNFIVNKRAGKTGRNISKNTAVKIPACYVPKFKPAKQFKEKVKKSVK